MKTSRIIHGFVALAGVLAADRVALAATCSANGQAKTNGTYAASQGPCTLNADNYYDFYLEQSPPAPTTQTLFPSIVADFAGTDANGRLKKLTADRIGACPNGGGTCASSFIKGDDPSTQPANETSSHAHVAIYNPNSSNDKLLLFVPGHGVNPKEYTHFALRAAAQGYHVVSLAYLNVVSADRCHDWQSNEFKNAPAPSVDDCISNMQRFKTEGTALSAAYQADFTASLRSELNDPSATAGPHDSIVNRLGLLLAWLDAQFPEQHWHDYFTVQCGFLGCRTVVDWSKVAVAAHSMGSNVSFYLARTHAVERLIMTSGPEEYLASNDTFGAGNVPSYVSSTAATTLDRLYVFCSLLDTNVCIRAQNAFINGFGASVANPYFDVDAGNPFDDSKRLLVTDQAPIPACGPHSWLISNCDPARPVWYRDTWDWMLSN